MTKDNVPASKRIADLEAQVKQLQDTLVLQKLSYEREIKLDVAAERERCAQLCRTIAEDMPNEDSAYWRGCMDVRAAILSTEAPQPSDESKR